MTMMMLTFQSVKTVNNNILNKQTLADNDGGDDD